MTLANICAMIFVIVAGVYLGFKSGWPGYELPFGYRPFSADRMLVGASTVFFAYIGFDSVARTAEEVKNPQRDLPMGIGFTLSICCSLYMHLLMHPLVDNMRRLIEHVDVPSYMYPFVGTAGSPTLYDYLIRGSCKND